MLHTDFDFSHSVRLQSVSSKVALLLLVFRLALQPFFPDITLLWTNLQVLQILQVPIQVFSVFFRFMFLKLRSFSHLTSFSFKGHERFQSCGYKIKLLMFCYFFIPFPTSFLIGLPLVLILLKKWYWLFFNTSEKILPLEIVSAGDHCDRSMSRQMLPLLLMFGW